MTASLVILSERRRHIDVDKKKSELVCVIKRTNSLIIIKFCMKTYRCGLALQAMHKHNDSQGWTFDLV